MHIQGERVRGSSRFYLLVIFSCANKGNKTDPWKTVTNSHLMISDSIGSMADPLQMLGIAKLMLVQDIQDVVCQRNETDFWEIT